MLGSMQQEGTEMKKRDRKRLFLMFTCSIVSQVNKDLLVHRHAQLYANKDRMAKSKLFAILHSLQTTLS